MKQEDAPIIDDLRKTIYYIETALTHQSFSPLEPPKEALGNVQRLFKRSLDERTSLPENLESAFSADVYVVALRHMYAFMPTEKQTPLSFLASVRFLNLLGTSHAMSGEEKKVGEEVLQKLKALQDPDTVFTTTYTQLGIYLTR